jgi:hypothetical protein
MCKKIKNDYKILNKKGLKKKISCLIWKIQSKRSLGNVCAAISRAPNDGVVTAMLACTSYKGRHATRGLCYLLRISNGCSQAGKFNPGWKPCHCRASCTSSPTGPCTAVRSGCNPYLGQLIVMQPTWPKAVGSGSTP